MTTPTKVIVALDWTPNGNHLGFYVAKDAGLYEAAGLDVRLLDPGSPEYAGSYIPGAEGAPKYVTPCSKVAEGSAHFAINSPEGVVGWNTAPGRPPLKAVAALLNDRNSSAIVTLKSSGRSRPKELDGCRYASYAARFEGRIVQRMIQNDGGTGDYIEDTPPMLGIWNTLLGEATTRIYDIRNTTKQGQKPAAACAQKKIKNNNNDMTGRIILYCSLVIYFLTDLISCLRY